MKNVLRLDAPRGTIVYGIFDENDNLINGEDHDKAEAMKHIKPNTKYVVEKIKIGDWSSLVYLYGVPCPLNTVHFAEESPSNVSELIHNELSQHYSVLTGFIKNPRNIASIEEAANVMIESIKLGGKIIACGNGGSMADAEHLVAELIGRYRKNRKPIPALVISDPAYLTCTLNDYGSNYVFSRSIMALAKSEDVVVLLTTSGRSGNIVMALKSAVVRGAKVIAITGNNGGDLDIPSLSTHINIPHKGTADRTQEMTILVIHILVMLIERGLGYVD